MGRLAGGEKALRQMNVLTRPFDVFNIDADLPVPADGAHDHAARV